LSRESDARRGMKLSDYVIDFLARKGVSHVFGISGGAAVHLFDSAARHPATDYVCTAHEQSAALAADGYARVTGKLGVAITTSGPGATNLLTGTCCSFYDSVPTLMITGQVATFRLKGERPVRQVGFQETDVVSIFSSVTKYAHQIRTPESIRYHLEKAYHLAFADRPGSVLIDLPDDLQRAEVDPARMDGYEPPKTAAPSFGEFDALVDLLRQARRPVLVLGGGLATPRLGDALDALVRQLGDVHEAVGVRQDFHEGAEIGDALDHALVDGADLRLGGETLDDVESLFDCLGIAGGDVHRAVVLDVDGDAGLVDDALDRLATGADDEPNLVGLDLDGGDARRVLGEVRSRRGERFEHLAEDVLAALLGLLEGAREDVS